VIQRLGKSLIFPIAVLPIAALLNRFGTLLSDTSIGIVKESAIWYIGKIMLAPGSAVFDNIAIIFAIGCAFGLSKDFRGEAALCGGVSFFVLQVLTSKGMLPEVFYKNVLTFRTTGNTSFSELLYLPLKNAKNEIINSLYIFNTGVIGGITVGVVIAILYNKFYEVKLIPALSFFGGRRFVPMISILTTMGLAFIFAIIWPWLQYSLISIGSWISQSSKDGISFKSGIGAAIYIFINRLMQPFGAHHILNTFLWFQFPIEGQLLDPSIYKDGVDGFYKSGDKFIVFGDINAFANGVIGSGIFQSG
ncbi:MAG: PTS N-acetylglucosamine IIC subunit, partial [Mycoplasma sp.]|nr:PTS N-acetylglucosamine IIC subunit [Mycoplasma sp.]